MNQKTFSKSYIVKRLLGVAFLAIGLWLLGNMVVTFHVLVDSAHTSRDFRALWVFGISALVLISAGVALIRKPSIFDGL